MCNQCHAYKILLTTKPSSPTNKTELSKDPISSACNVTCKFKPGTQTLECSLNQKGQIRRFSEECSELIIEDQCTNTNHIITPRNCSEETTINTPTTISPTIISCSPVAMDTLPATLHGVYMTVLLVLVAVTITMTTLVVYMCLMMRRAKSGRVPQTTTGTTHTNNMAASDYCEPISLRHFQNTNGGVYM